MPRRNGNGKESTRVHGVTPDGGKETRIIIRKKMKTNSFRLGVKN